ncbi:dihydroxyacetone kinase phosphoryl donor subunit DhaM [Brachybacterium nesterenkovii]|uniref:phosphoenolpyruvate--glycerone phosphotransferase n=1 Tax=Brachybacterium nesterenkovii TaxID=47847 RepID=A0A1X6X0W6_9MICO|nr:dihydroxyacetone kinase phosphoryl donor subunit DhaM [Brachybacterium nesterenkovii]SLM92085.1 Phosphoenolpyruvate-dihydroxyacetone phosphotransferase, subunit DhaM; DHA-specific IIA component / DHA-specific phosphocarrier protein HPr / DHA-specific EI component [Brachybacterium nesterenkovii]
MTGIVVVSHSRPLATAAVDLASQMLRSGGPRIEVAAGLSDTELGTDAAAIQTAIEAAMDDQGVVVLMDLGSAIMSAEMAVEMLDEDDAARVRLSWAPLVEGLIGAAVTAAGGADREEVATQAELAAEAKRMQVTGG